MTIASCGNAALAYFTGVASTISSQPKRSYDNGQRWAWQHCILKN